MNWLGCKNFARRIHENFVIFTTSRILDRTFDGNIARWFLQMVDSYYKWQIVGKGRQVLYFKFESIIPQDQVDDVKLILSSMLSIIALSSINYIYI